METHQRKTDQVIISDGILAVENGKATRGPPAMTEEVEKEIYKALSYRRNAARSLEENVPGGNRGSQQSRHEYDLVAKGFMARYGISAEDIDAIMRKGEEQGWK